MWRTHDNKVARILKIPLQSTVKPTNTAFFNRKKKYRIYWLTFPPVPLVQGGRNFIAFKIASQVFAPFRILEIAAYKSIKPDCCLFFHVFYNFCYSVALFNEESNSLFLLHILALALCAFSSSSILL